MASAAISEMEAGNGDRDRHPERREIAVIFTSGEGHHVHDGLPGFKAWNEIADAYQVGEPLAFGGETIVQLGG